MESTTCKRKLSPIKHGSYGKLCKDVWQILLLKSTWPLFNKASRCSKTLRALCKVLSEYLLCDALCQRRAARYKQARNALLKSAIGKHPEALNHLGYAFETGGWVLAANETLSYKCFARSAALGNETGLIEQATKLYHGVGCEEDRQKALEYTQRVTSDSYALAVKWYEFVTHCDTTSAVIREETISRFLKSADVENNEYAQIELGNLYAIVDISKARNWYERAAAQGNAQALYQLSMVEDIAFLNRSDGASLRTKAATQRHVQAKESLKGGF